jgi:Ca-activated chloride channel family protein
MNTIESLPLPTLVLTPLRQGVPASGGALEVLVRVQAPAAPAGASAAAARSQLRLALVVDRSGSMSGQPLQQALRCVSHIVQRLQPQDQVAVVLYDNRVDVAVPLQPAAQKHAILAALAGVESGGNTALFEGWLAGAQQLGAGQAGAISRVLLLSDGQANMGPSDLADVAPHCAQWRDLGVSTTTVGLGSGFNEDLMVGMARTGGGQAYYGQTAEDLHDSFDEELALLEALFLRHLRAKPVAAEGVIAEALSALDLPAPDGWRTLSDLPWGAESWLLLRLHVGAQAPSGGAPRPLLALNFEAVRKDGSAVQITAPVLALPVVSDEAVAALPQDETVARRVQEIDFARASAEARELLMRGESDAARERLRWLESRVQAHPWLAEKIVRLRELVDRDAAMAAKEMRFKSSRMNTRVTQVNERIYSADETDSVEVPAYLRRKAEEGRGRKS